MLDFSNIARLRRNAQAAARENADREISSYIYELVSVLPDERLAMIAEDLDIFDKTGFVPPMIDGIIERAICLSDADRILRKF